MNLGSLITSHLGSRSLLAQYQYHDMVKALWMVFFAGGDCAEDLSGNLAEELSQVDNLKVCSADTALRLQKLLSEDKETVLSKALVVNEFSKHETLNKLNLEMLLLTGQLAEGQSYDLDFDNQFIPCEKYDARKSYKMKHGYFPGVASIGRHILYLENRNGNSNVKFKQEDTLERVYGLLWSKNIRVRRSRMDCGSFTKDVIGVIEKHSELFYIRAQRCDDLSAHIRRVTDWEKVTINFKVVEVAGIEYKPFNQDKAYRYVVQREPGSDGQVDVFTQDHFSYRAIITNDRDLTCQQVIEYYNQRGASEKLFDEMNNDFGWSKLPFSFLNENTVYMLLMAMCRNFYLYVRDRIAKKVDFVSNTFRLKRFIFRFIVVPCKWIKKGGQKTLKLFTSKPYHLLVE